VEEFLHARGVTVQYIEQTFERTPAGRLQSGIMGELAEYESELIRERTTRGRSRKASESGRLPVYCRTYGYRQITVAQSQVVAEYLGRSGALVVVEEEAEVVRRIFDLCAGGMTLEQIAVTLHREGVSPRLGGVWSPNSVRTILRNETYVGRLYYNRSVTVRTGATSATGSAQRRRTLRPPADWIRMDCPAIIDEALFQTVQARLDFNRERLRGRRTSVWLLHGVVSCKHCLTQSGTPLACAGTVGWNEPGKKVYRYYRCTSRRRLNLPDCGTVFPADLLEGMAMEALRRVATPERMSRIARQQAESARRMAGNPGSEVKRLDRALAALDVEEGRLADLILAGVSRNVVAGKVKDLADRRQALLTDVNRARAKAAIDSPADAARRGEELGRWLRDSLDSAEADPEQIQALYRLFLRVSIYRGEQPEITITVPSSVK
jgi:site-specific DNA recombinase